MGTCLLCGIDAQESSSEKAITYTCEACGKYSATRYWIRTVVEQNALSSDDRIKLRGVVRDETDRLGQCQTVIGDAGESDCCPYQEVIARHNAPTVLGQVHRFLVAAYKETKHFGAPAKYSLSAVLARRLYLDDEATNAFLAAVAESGYAKAPSFDGKGFSIELTMAGLLLVELLAKSELDEGEKLRLLYAALNFASISPSCVPSAISSGV